MSKFALKLLNDLDLLDSDKPTEISELSENELRKSLTHYFGERTKNADEELKHIPGESSLNVLFSSFSSKSDLDIILPSSLVHGHIIVNDPLYRLCAPESKASKVHAKYYGITSDSSLDYSAIRDSILFYSNLAPMIRANLVTILPLGILHKEPEQIPIYHSEDRFRSEIPDNIHDFIHQNAVVKPVVLKKETGDLLVLSKEAKDPCRAINIDFNNDYCRSGVSLYFYQEAITEEVNKKTGEFKMRMSWDPDKAMDNETFQAWVYQSINRTIIARIQSIGLESKLAEKLDHSYLTQSNFESELLRQSGFRGEDVLTNSINFLNANDSLIKIPSVETVVKLREDNEHSFSRFRSSLLDIGEQLSGIPEPEFQSKAERLYWKEVQPQIDEIKNDINHIQGSFTKGALVSLGGVAIAVASGTAIPLIAALLYAGTGALTEALPSVSEYMSKRKRPEYIWNQLKK